MRRLNNVHSFLASRIYCASVDRYFLNQEINKVMSKKYNRRRGSEYMYLSGKLDMLNMVIYNNF
jgi:hypothetical protein